MTTWFERRLMIRLRAPLRCTARLIGAALLGVAGLPAVAHAQAAVPAGANDAGATPVVRPSGTSGTSAVLLSQPAAPAIPVPKSMCRWPLYDRFIKSNVQADGRVIDYGPPVQTTSEGQSYGLFFALVDNDRETFDRILAWTQSNLASGDLTQRLPAWRWGQRPDGAYGIIDANSASDSDLWIAYDLAEAGRLWKVPRYTAMARTMFMLISRREVFDLPGLGPMLAPGQSGFALAGDLWRINPSYMPLPLLRVAAQYDQEGPWNKIAANTVKMLQSVSPHGFAPDWAAFQTGRGFVVDPQKGDVGSYDAIRVYLWAGLTASADPLAKPYRAAVSGMQTVLSSTGQLPEKVATLSGMTSGAAPAGFMAAMLPLLRATGAAPLNAARARVNELTSSQTALNYYNGVLTLFGAGALDNRYQFTARGRLQPDWSARCNEGTR